MTKKARDEDEVLTACALRFDGYLYETTVGIAEPDSCGFGAGLAKLAEPVVERYELHADPERNFGAFFILQRYLYKWGGERLTPHTRDHIAFRFLFLDLYRLPVPEPFRHAEYCERWEREFAPEREVYAAMIRRTFRRRGRGPQLYP